VPTCATPSEPFWDDPTALPRERAERRLNHVVRRAEFDINGSRRSLSDQSGR
jgi:hypothetical protein